jgi:hypothetical protein
MPLNYSIFYLLHLYFYKIEKTINYTQTIKNGTTCNRF